MLPIILAIDNEDDRAFVENIYLTYGRKIYLVAYGILNNKDDAEDCIHDVVKSIIDNLDLFRPLDYQHLINMLVKCTRNAAIDKYRINKKRNQNETSLYINEKSDDDDDDLTDNSDFVTDIIINEENKRRLSELIMELPPIYQDAIYLKYCMDMTISEISKILNISENVVKTRLFRAKKTLFSTREGELNDLRKN